MADAACLEHEELDWFAARDEAAAVDVCSRCLVQTDCRIYATKYRVDFGVWGGLTAEERRRGDAGPRRRSQRVA